MEKATSTGRDPILAHYDILHDTYQFRLDGAFYEWPSKSLPFTLKTINGMQFADRALVEQFGGAKV
jgi:hypothetical protein